MGKSAAKQSQALSTSAGNQALGAASSLSNLSTPALTQAVNYNSDIVSGDPTKLAAVTAPQVNQSREDYNTAQQQIMRTMSGGSRNQALTDLENSHAGDVSRILTGGVQNAVNTLGQLGTGGTQLSLSGLSSANTAGQSLGNLASAKAQAIGAGVGGIGGGVGSIIGSNSIASAISGG